MEQQGGRGRSGSMQARKPHLLLGLTGSVEATKIEELVDTLSGWAQVRLVFTPNTARFVKTDLKALLEGRCEVFSDEDEWKWSKKGDSVLHIQLRDWADVFVIAPLSANSLAKLALGLCDNLVTCVARAWEMEDRALIVCPAMDPKMWQHPITDVHLSTLRGWGVTVVSPVEAVQPDGEMAVGPMQDVVVISNEVQDTMRHFA